MKEIEIIIPIWETEMKIIDKLDKEIVKLLINSAVNSTVKYCGKEFNDFDSVKICYIVRPDDK